MTIEGREASIGGRGEVKRSALPLKRRLPWWMKIGGKLVLARLPAPYDLWRRLSLFQRGAMHRPEYAFGVFRKHFDRAGLSARPPGFVGLELGPGDSLSSMLVARALGASRYYLIDSGPYAATDLEIYREMIRFLAARGLALSDAPECRSLRELLTACRSTYLTDGLDSFRGIPDRSIDFIWSHSVLEHVRRSQLAEILRQTRRILSPSGVCSHRVDLRDHLGDALDNLRFGDRFWESPRVANSGFYTNRLRYAELLGLFTRTGFEVETLRVDRWERLPTPRRSLAKPYRDLSDEELLVSGFDLLLRPS